MASSTQPIPVVCAIIEQGSTFLAARRNAYPKEAHPKEARVSNAGLWEFPGGKVHTDEDAVSALKREIREELNTSIIVKSPLPPVIYNYSWIAIELLSFICSVEVTRKLQSSDHDLLQFYTPVEALSLHWAQADQIVLQHYMDWIIASKEGSLK